MVIMAEAYVTLATNDPYAVGCLVLAESLRKCGTTKKIAVMVTSTVSPEMTQQLKNTFDYVKEVAEIDSQDPRHLHLLGRPELGITVTKIKCWLMTKYEKCVFLDADTLVLKSIDELFLRKEFSAAPDVGWPDCFNSGVFVYEPSEETYSNLEDMMMTSGSFDGGDQGLLNMYFRNWADRDMSTHLPFIYNVASHAFYSYLPAIMRYKDDVKVVHFIGPIKPWHHAYDTERKQLMVRQGSEQSSEYLNKWWDILLDLVLPQMSTKLRDYVINLSHIIPIAQAPSPKKEVAEAPRPFDAIQQQLDAAMLQGVGENIIHDSQRPFPGLDSDRGSRRSDMGILTDQKELSESATQVAKDEIVTETGMSSKNANKQKQQSKSGDNQSNLRTILTHVDVKNPAQILTTVSADQDANAQFRVKSLNSEAARAEILGEKPLESSSDDVKMIFEFKCTYLPKGSEQQRNTYY